MGTRRPAALPFSAVTTPPYSRSPKRRTWRFLLETQARWTQRACGRTTFCCCERRTCPRAALWLRRRVHFLPNPSVEPHHEALLQLISSQVSRTDVVATQPAKLQP